MEILVTCFKKIKEIIYSELASFGSSACSLDNKLKEELELLQMGISPPNIKQVMNCLTNKF